MQTPQPGPAKRALGTGLWGSLGAGGQRDPWLGGIFSDLLNALVTAGKIELPLPPGLPRYLQQVAASTGAAPGEVSLIKTEA